MSIRGVYLNNIYTLHIFSPIVNIELQFNW